MKIKVNDSEVNFVVQFSKRKTGAGFMKYNQGTLNKVEKILDEGEYVVRYERGNFQSGYCVLEAKKVVVLNKFLSVEGRINALIDLLPQLKINIDLLTHESQKLYESLCRKQETEQALQTSLDLT